MVRAICGWVGMALIVTAFAAISWLGLNPRGVPYQLMNVAGSSLLLIDLVPKLAWPAVGLQVVWILIALVALVQVVLL